MISGPSLPAIIIVDDNPADAQLLARVLKKAKILNPIVVLGGGHELIDTLTRTTDIWPEAPAIIFVDWQMPGMDGPAVLQWLAARPKIQTCIVVLTGMKDINSQRHAYQLGAHSFLTKPIDSGDIVSVLNGLRHARLDTTPDGQVARYSATEGSAGSNPADDLRSSSRLL